MTLSVDPALTANTAPLPGRLATIHRPAEGEITRTRDFLLAMGDADHGGDRTHGGHAAMDYNEHAQTYQRFIMFIKVSVVFLVILLGGMAYFLV